MPNICKQMSYFLKFFVSKPTLLNFSYKDKDYGKDQKNRSDNVRPSFGAQFETATLDNSCCHFESLKKERHLVFLLN